ncbi:AAA family ATPase [Bacteroides uniformis]|nr:AAA family ATPase [Bacteroides uniformis]
MQLIEEWEKSVNSYSQDYTEEYELFISGSNSRMLSGELATLLSGRYVQFPVYPFSYRGVYRDKASGTEPRELYEYGRNPGTFCLARKAGGVAQLLVCLEGHHLAEGHQPTLQHT